MIIVFEVKSGSPCPIRFSHTDSKSLFRWLAEGHAWRIELPDHIGAIAEELGVDISTLGTVGTEEYTVGEYILMAGEDPHEQEQAKAAWDRDHERNVKSWQDPKRLSVQLSAFIGALDRSPSIYSDLGINDPYFVEDFFRRDLSDLYAMAEWAISSGEDEVRLAAV
jgi:hypothetical protein